MLVVEASSWQNSNMYFYSRRVHFYETDLMKVVHHGNYLRFFEEARVDWALNRGIITSEASALQLAVVKSTVEYLKALKFGDVICVKLQVKAEGLRIFIQYWLHRESDGALCARGETVHVGVDENLKIMRLSEKIKSVLEKEPWTEI